jgi:hypothetical protein
MKIQLPIDTSAVFIDVIPPELVLDRRTKPSAADAETGRRAQQWRTTGLNR